MGATWAMASGARFMVLRSETVPGTCGRQTGAARRRRAHVDLFGSDMKEEAANRLPRARLLHVTHALIVRACHLPL